MSSPVGFTRVQQRQEAAGNAKNYELALPAAGPDEQGVNFVVVNPTDAAITFTQDGGGDPFTVLPNSYFTIKGCTNLNQLAFAGTGTIQVRVEK